jgi:hypothetical protein
MMRTLFVLLVGLVIGVAGTLLYLHGFGSSGERSPAGSDGLAADSGRVSNALTDPLPAPLAYQASRAAHERLAGVTDSAELVSQIELIARLPRSAQAAAELDALVSRLAVVDPRAAVALALDLDLDDATIARLFKVWADLDPEAALAEAVVSAPPATRRAVSLALLDVFGLDIAGIDRIASAFAYPDAMNFRVDAIANLAERDLLGALDAASDTALPQAVQSQVLIRIAQVMAPIDPAAAFEQARSIKIPLFRSRYLNSLLDEWAKLDPADLLGYLETADLPEISLGPASFHALAASGPERLLALAERFAPTTRTAAQAAALEVLTALDPITAYDRIKSLPTSGDISGLVRTIADGFAAQDPNAALAWATSLEPRSPDALNSVLSRVAATDPIRTAEVVIAEILDPVAARGSDMPSLVTVLQSALRAGSPEIAQVADRLAAHADPRVSLQLDQLLTTWPQVDPDGALNWAMSNVSSLTASTAATFAQRVGAQAPTQARQTLQQLPPALRGAWLEGAASGMAGSDLAGTLSWIEQYNSDPAYERARTATLRSGAAGDPQAVARLLQDDSELLGQLAPTIASAWASSDPATAREWVLELPQGRVRDQGLQALMQSTLGTGTFDTGLLERMSSDEARRQMVLSSLFLLGRTDPQLGRRLIEEYIDDPNMRRDAEARLAAGR